MKWAEFVVRGGPRMYSVLVGKNLKEREHTENVDIDGRTIVR
jgi:hypothetical protein